jgi:hypothetical protein
MRLLHGTPFTINLQIEGQEMIDYALHRILIEQYIKTSQKQALTHDYDGAAETMLKIVAEAKLAYNAFMEMKNARG